MRTDAVLKSGFEEAAIGGNWLLWTLQLRELSGNFSEILEWTMASRFSFQTVLHRPVPISVLVIHFSAAKRPHSSRPNLEMASGGHCRPP